MKKYLFGITIFIICISVVSVSSVSAVGDTPYSWYCVRNKEHKQPLADSAMRFVEQYNAYYVDRQHGDETTEKIVYLTFDAGYENGNVAKILDILKEESVSGAFFVLGHLVNSQPELLRRMQQEGHIVANHTYHHKDMTTLDQFEQFEEELVSLNKRYYDVTGAQMANYYRPPEGKFDERSLSYAQRMGYQTIFWSLAYADWDNAHQPSEEAAMNKLRAYMHNGAIILLHPTSETNTKILAPFIRELKASGYRFGTLDELTHETP